MLKDIYIVDGLRTPIGRPYRGLKKFSAHKLAAFVIKELLHRNKINKINKIDSVFLGNTVSAGTGQNLARLASLEAGVSVETPSITINSVCASSLQAVIEASRQVLCGDANLVIAGGTESASQSPTIIDGINSDDSIETLINDGLTCHWSEKHMGELAEDLAKEQGITKQQQDECAYASYQKSYKAVDDGVLEEEILSVKVDGQKVLEKDEWLLKRISKEKIDSLPPSFKKEGTVTAGNASALGDGAAAILLTSEEALKSNKLNPKARILGYSNVALDPKDVFKAGVPAIKKCLSKASLQLDKVDLFEISEAFAAQMVFTLKELKLPQEKVNIYGGDISLGHPLGAVGARLLVTLMHALKRQNKNIGVACACYGGGGATAIAIEMVK